MKVVACLFRGAFVADEATRQPRRHVVHVHESKASHIMNRTNTEATAKHYHHFDCSYDSVPEKHIFAGAYRMGSMLSLTSLAMDVNGRTRNKACGHNSPCCSLFFSNRWDWAGVCLSYIPGAISGIPFV